MSSEQHNPQTADSLKEAMLLVSRQIDGDRLSDEDLARLSVLEVELSKGVTAFREQCLNARRGLQQIPIHQVPTLLFECSEEADRGIAASVIPNRRKKIIWGGLAAVVSACALLAFLQLPFSAFSDRTPDAQSVAGREMASFDSGSDVPGISMAAAPMSGESSTNREAGELQTILESENWQIVVVHVDAKDRAAAMQQVDSIVHEHGLSLVNSAGDDHPEWMGVVLRSGGAASDQAIAAMEKTSRTPVERDPQQVVKSSRQEIIDAVRLSLQHPTQSELHHGRICVALPGRNPPADILPATVPSDYAVAAKDAKKETATEQIMGDTASARRSDGASRPSAAPVTMVVFDFGSDKSVPSEESSKKQI